MNHYTDSVLHGPRDDDDGANLQNKIIGKMAKYDNYHHLRGRPLAIWHKHVLGYY